LVAKPKKSEILANIGSFLTQGQGVCISASPSASPECLNAALEGQSQMGETDQVILRGLTL